MTEKENELSTTKANGLQLAWNVKGEKDVMLVVYGLPPYSAENALVQTVDVSVQNRSVPNSRD